SDGCAALRHLHSFPTRRSSDLAISSTARLGTSFLTLMTVLGGLLVLLPVWRSDVHLDLQLLTATLLLMVVSAALVRLAAHGVRRSEEHTSELQSREKLVCRLLL